MQNDEPKEVPVQANECDAAGYTPSMRELLDSLGGYQKVFNAIADATSPYADTAVQISVRDFIRSINPHRIESTRAAGEGRSNGAGEVSAFNLTWIAPPSAPLADGRRVHPNPMTGRQSFLTFQDAVEFFGKRVAGSEFVSLTERITRTVDRSNEALAALAQPKGGDHG